MKLPTIQMVSDKWFQFEGESLDICMSCSVSVPVILIFFLHCSCLAKGFGKVNVYWKFGFMAQVVGGLSCCFMPLFISTSVTCAEHHSVAIDFGKFCLNAFR